MKIKSADALIVPAKDWIVAGRRRPAATCEPTALSLARLTPSGKNLRKTKSATASVFVCRQERLRLFKMLRLHQQLGGASEQRTA